MPTPDTSAQRARWRAYKRRLSKDKTAVRFYCTPAEHRLLKGAAHAADMPVATYAKEAATSAAKGSSLVPRYLATQAQQLLVQCRREGNLLNQIAHRVNTEREAKLGDVIALNQWIDERERTLAAFFSHVPNLTVLIAEDVRTNPAHVYRYRVLFALGATIPAECFAEA